MANEASMSKPATKEPSMDEILSSIRQIIADDDAAVPRRPAGAPPYAASASAAPQSLAATTPPNTLGRFVPEEIRDEPEPLNLSRDQIVSEESTGGTDSPVSEPQQELAAAPEPTIESEPELVEPEDIGFTAAPEPQRPIPTVPSYERPAPRPFEPSPITAAAAAPMPDPNLSRDIAEQLLEPATNAAVRSTFTRLNKLGVGAPGLTLESIVRELLRPMLKDWLDENLPAVVERMVEKEIQRVSRGLEE